MTKKSKSEELVLVVPKTGVNKLGLPGVFVIEEHPELKHNFLELISKGLFHKRGLAEESKTHVQPIPYVVVCNDQNEFLVYNRGSKGGEKRLADKWSMGVGGHVNPGDQEVTDSSFNMKDLMVAVCRELQEELVGLPDESLGLLRPVGVFYNEETPVNAVHLGIVFVLHIKGNEFHKMGDYVKKYQWATAKVLSGMKLESWSETVLQFFVPRELGPIENNRPVNDAEKDIKHAKMRRTKLKEPSEVKYPQPIRGKRGERKKRVAKNNFQ